VVRWLLAKKLSFSCHEFEMLALKLNVSSCNLDWKKF
jgi:hypothetical protein